MGNINSGQLTCSNLDKLQVLNFMGNINSGQLTCSNLDKLQVLNFMGNINSGQLTCSNLDKLQVLIGKVAFPIGVQHRSDKHRSAGLSLTLHITFMGNINSGN